MYEYKVVQVREGLIGGKMSADKLEKVLNEYAQKGWQAEVRDGGRGEGPARPGWHRGRARDVRAPAPA